MTSLSSQPGNQRDFVKCKPEVTSLRVEIKVPELSGSVSPPPGKPTPSSQPHWPLGCFCSLYLGRLVPQGFVCTIHSAGNSLPSHGSLLLLPTASLGSKNFVISENFFWSSCFVLYSQFPASFIFLHSTCCHLKLYTFYISILFIVCLLWECELCQGRKFYLFCSLTSGEILGKWCDFYSSVSFSIKCRWQCPQPHRATWDCNKDM